MMREILILVGMLALAGCQSGENGDSRAGLTKRQADSALGASGLPGAAVWGAAAGLFVGALPFAIAESTPALARWQLGTVILGSITLLAALSAVVSALVARYAARRNTPARARAPR